MRFLILTQFFPPEIGAPQTRLQSIATELLRMGHEVEIVTALPNYPTGKPFPGYERCFYRREILEGVVVHRVWLYPALGTGIKRMMNYVSFTLASFVGLFRARKPDYIFVESPPLLLSVPAYIASRFWRVPFIFNVSDLWPDAIADGGFLNRGFLLRRLAALEIWSYRKAAYVNAVTEGVRDTLLRKKSVPPEKIMFLPNGVDTVLFQPRPPDAGLRAQLRLDGKRVVLWAGTLGFAHGIEHILQAAKSLGSEPEIHFLFVGDGSAKSELQSLAKQMELRNVTFCDPVPPEVLARYFSIAQVGLASLTNIPLWNATRPAKLFPLFASGKPVVFAGAGEGAHLVQQAKAGIVVPPEDSGALAEAVRRLVGDPELCEELGRNGRRFVGANLQWSDLVRRWTIRLSQMQTREALRARATRDWKRSDSITRELP